ncbi:MAG: hypothetical protein KC609_08660 [Myxococcales bacterium]|nr:hypothetical protein [Myxococcales bacterium]
MRPVYTTFHDDAFHYTCHGCGLCCHGNGLVMDMEREGVQMLRRYPALRYFVVRSGRLTSLENAHDRCWFLADDARCGIELELGKDQKPFLCNLFPYKPIGEHRGVLIVTLNTLCPMHLDANPRSTSLTRAGFEREYERLDIASMGTLIKPLGDVALDLDREEEIKSWCADPTAAPPYLELVTRQLALTSSGCATDPEGDLARTRRRWSELFGLETEPHDEGDRDVDRLMMVLTPLLRLEIGGDARRKALTLMGIDVLARQIRTLAGRIRPTQITALRTRVPLLRFLVALDEIPRPSRRRGAKTTSAPQSERMRRARAKLEGALASNHHYRLTTYELLRSLALPPELLIELCLSLWPESRPLRVFPTS